MLTKAECEWDGSFSLISHLSCRDRWLSEVLQGMRLVRFYAYEESFLHKLLDVRELELVQLAKLNCKNMMTRMRGNGNADVYDEDDAAPFK